MIQHRRSEQSSVPLPGSLQPAVLDSLQNR